MPHFFHPAINHESEARLGVITMFHFATVRLIISKKKKKKIACERGMYTWAITVMHFLLSISQEMIKKAIIKG